MMAARAAPAPSAEDSLATLLMMIGTHAASQLDERFDDRCDFDTWPPIPIHVVAGREDRFFPLFRSASHANGLVSIRLSCPAGTLPPSATRTNSPRSSPGTSDRHELIASTTLNTWLVRR